SEFNIRSGMSTYQILNHFPSWREAVRVAGLEPNSTNIKLDDDKLLEDWGDLVRKNRHIPTRAQYRREGKYSPGGFERHFGPWSVIPAKFRTFAQDKPEWTDVLELLPITAPKRSGGNDSRPARSNSSESQQRHPRLDDRPTYGNPIDFRGLRHEPV